MASTGILRKKRTHARKKRTHARKERTHAQQIWTAADDEKLRELTHISKGICLWGTVGVLLGRRAEDCYARFQQLSGAEASSPPVLTFGPEEHLLPPHHPSDAHHDSLQSVVNYTGGGPEKKAAMENYTAGNKKREDLIKNWNNSFGFFAENLGKHVELEHEIEKMYRLMSKRGQSLRRNISGASAHKDKLFYLYLELPVDKQKEVSDQLKTTLDDMKRTLEKVQKKIA